MPSFGKQGRLLVIIMLSSFLLNLTFGAYRSIFNNFAVEEIGVLPGAYGLLEGIREIPGLLAMFLLAAMAFIKDERLYALSGGMIAVGIWLYAGAGGYGDLVFATLVQSVGFHIYFVVQDSMVIRTTEVGDRARRLGQINSAAAAGTMVGMVMVLLTNQWFNFRQYFAIFGAVGVIGSLVALLIKPNPEAARRSSFVFDWRFRSYYILTLLSGARRHIVLTFASYALVKLHGTPVSTMVTLLMIISMLAIFTRPLIGRIIDKVGEQRALSLNYAVVALVFLGYAFVQEAYVVYALYVLDNVLTGFDIAISTHAGRIIPREKLSASLATGTTINHIFGVTVPMAGGLLWEWFGPQIPFLMGVGIVLAAIAYSWNLDAKTARAQAALAAVD
ncbi:MAG: MFS transporter [Bacillota bacterium]